MPSVCVAQKMSPPIALVPTGMSWQLFDDFPWNAGSDIQVPINNNQQCASGPKTFKGYTALKNGWNVGLTAETRDSSQDSMSTGQHHLRSQRLLFFSCQAAASVSLSYQVTRMTLKQISVFYFKGGWDTCGQSLFLAMIHYANGKKLSESDQRKRIRHVNTHSDNFYIWNISPFLSVLYHVKSKMSSWEDAPLSLGHFYLPWESWWSCASSQYWAFQYFWVT